MSTPTASQTEPAALSPEQRRQDYRNAMARLGAAVNIVTTDGPGGRGGFAATAVCSVTDTPPTLLVCLNRHSSAYEAVKANGVVCINVLEGRHAELSQLFGGKTPVSERFRNGRWSTMVTGAPVLEDALVSLDCRIRNVADGGTHDILLCEVSALRESGEGEALIYFDRRYHQLRNPA